MTTITTLSPTARRIRFEPSSSSFGEQEKRNETVCYCRKDLDHTMEYISESQSQPIKICAISLYWDAHFWMLGENRRNRASQAFFDFVADEHESVRKRNSSRLFILSLPTFSLYYLRFRSSKRTVRFIYKDTSQEDPRSIYFRLLTQPEGSGSAPSVCIVRQKDNSGCF